MSIWTSSPNTLAAALFCADLSTLSGTAFAAIDLSAAKPSEVRNQIPVAEDAVVISAPDGFCIDRLGSVTHTRDAFVLLTPCDSGVTARQGLLTASVLGQSTDHSMPPIDDLDAYFATPHGRAVLSRSGDASGLTVSESYARGGAFYVHAIEGGSDGVLGTHSWRAIFEVNGCMVTATLRDLDGHPISSNGGFSMVHRFVDNIVSASQRD